MFTGMLNKKHEIMIFFSLSSRTFVLSSESETTMFSCLILTNGNKVNSLSKLFTLNNFLNIITFGVKLGNIQKAIN